MTKILKIDQNNCILYFETLKPITINCIRGEAVQKAQQLAVHIKILLKQKADYGQITKEVA